MVGPKAGGVPWNSYMERKLGETVLLINLNIALKFQKW
jgi:hypothetical protein